MIPKLIQRYLSTTKARDLIKIYLKFNLLMVFSFIAETTAELSVRETWKPKRWINLHVDSLKTKLLMFRCGTLEIFRNLFF